MCGIAGILRFDGRLPHADRAQAMLEHLRDRGPDGAAVRPLGPCTLVHRRLSVIDPPGGAQPMGLKADLDGGGLWVVFNGMIYNHVGLRRRLEGHGHRFTSDHSDTEVLLHGYRQWETALPAHLDGMFAFAIWDVARRTLFLCRDRVGKKPLYVWRRPGEIAFASLIGALLAGAPSDAPIDVNRAALTRFLQLGYGFTPSLVAGIEEIPAGHWLQTDVSGRARSGAYWTWPQPEADAARAAATEDVSAAVTALRPRLEAAVRRRLVADVPLGCFLSGGVDSALVAALAQQELRARGGDALRTFSVAMPVAEYDERDAARRTAAHIGSAHHELVAEPGSGVIADLDALIRHIGEPTADSSLLPTWWLSRAAREHVTVALSGDGGDELFGGYDRYRAMNLLGGHRWWLRLLKPLVRSDPRRPRARRSRLRRLAEAAASADPAVQYQCIMHLFDGPSLRALGVAADGPAPARIEHWSAAPDRVAAARHWDLGHYLPYDLLRKVDRASMAAGLEVRCPLLDGAVCELAGALRPPDLMPRGRPKGLLKALAAPLLPAETLSRPKRGFAVPIGPWFRQPLRAELSEHLLAGDLERLGLRRGPVEHMLDEHVSARSDHAHRLFALLGLTLWWRRVESLKHARRSAATCERDTT